MIEGPILLLKGNPGNEGARAMMHAIVVPVSGRRD